MRRPGGDAALLSAIFHYCRRQVNTAGRHLLIIRSRSRACCSPGPRAGRFLLTSIPYCAGQFLLRQVDADDDIATAWFH